jgi:hypothetical protein
VEGIELAKKVVMELSEKQAKVIQDALEEYFRLRLGQANISGLADDLAFSTYEKCMDPTGKYFDLAIQRRDSINQLLSAIFYITWPVYGAPEKRSDSELIAGDIWSLLRWELSNKESYRSTPIQLGPEPLPKIELFEEVSADARKTDKTR